MTPKGFVILPVLIISLAVIIAGALIAYKPTINCQFGECKQKQRDYMVKDSGQIVPMEQSITVARK